MTQHTQGEWVVSEARMAPGGICGRYIAHTDGSRIAEAFFNCRVNSAEELEANARLIAAAPDLLEALQSAQRFIKNGIEFGYIRMPDADTPDPAHQTPNIIAAAIAKATGSAA